MNGWLILALVAAGIATGAAWPGRFEAAFTNATLYVFLPPLLFEAAWNLDARVLARCWSPVFALAVPGVLITTAVVGIALHLAGLSWAAALLAGAIVSATDPIAIVATFKKMPVPQALATIVQSESLLNDAMAVVVYRAVLTTFIAAAGAAAAGWATATAVLGIAGGLALGVALAYGIAFAAVRRNAAAVQVAATLAGAYGAYFAAEAVHASALFAVIAFGVALRAFERHVLDVAIAAAVERTWDVLALLSNVAVFFLTGTAVEIGRAVREPLLGAAAVAGILAARLLLAYGLIPLAMRDAPRSWMHVIRAAGARGALALALALALPAAVAERGAVVDVTLAIVVVTLAASAFGVPRAVRSLPLRSGAAADTVTP